MFTYIFTLHPEQAVSIPQDHGYMLRSALSNQFPFLHGRHDLQIAPVRGGRTQEKQPRIRLEPETFLYIRGLSAEEVVEMMKPEPFLLNGIPVHVVGVRKVDHEPTPILVSRLVLLQDTVDPISFRERLAEKLPAGVSIEVGRSRAAVVKILEGGRKVFWKGYAVKLTNLTPEQSLQILSTGVGHGRSIGCGVFYPGTMNAK